VSAPQFLVREVELYERDVHLRMPFRFGVVTLRDAPQCFVRVRIELPDGRSKWGAAAELLAPKWFDKNPVLSNEDNFDQLRLSLSQAADAYSQARKPCSAFGHFAVHYDELIAAGATRGLNPLIANFGPAQLDRAILDALGRIAGHSFYDVIRNNLAGIDLALLSQHLSDLAGFDIARFLATLAPARSIAARHTVGLVERPPGAGWRRLAGIAGRGRCRLRPHVLQAQGRRRSSRRSTKADRDRRGAGSDCRAVFRLARWQRAI
jgi:hypothetical protein